MLSPVRNLNNILIQNEDKMAIDTPKNSDRDEAKDRMVTALRSTVDGLKDKCLKLS